jgi:hypothetical protein
VLEKGRDLEDLDVISPLSLAKHPRT